MTALNIAHQPDEGKMTDPTMTPTDLLRDALATLHAARLSAAATDAQVAEVRRAWEGAHADLLTEQRERHETLQRCEAMVRQVGLAHFEVTQERKPLDGLEIVLTTMVEITDEGLTRDWAHRSGTGLVLDRKAIEKAAKTLPIPGVTVTQVPSTRIASDLGKALGTVEAPATAGGVA